MPFKDFERVYPLPELVSVDPCGCVEVWTGMRYVQVASCAQYMSKDLPGVGVTEEGALFGVAV